MTISISLDKGEIKGIIGANGIGKTTLLKKIREESSFKIALLNQEPLKTLSHLTTRHIIDSLRHDFADEIDESMLTEFDFFKKFKMDKFLDTGVAQLSGGENQCLKIYSTFMITADQYFLDEPTSFLDGEKKELLASLIQFYQTQEKSFLIIEHDQNYLKNLTNVLIQL